MDCLWHFIAARSSTYPNLPDTACLLITSSTCSPHECKFWWLRLSTGFGHYLCTLMLCPRFAKFPVPCSRASTLCWHVKICLSTCLSRYPALSSYSNKCPRPGFPSSHEASPLLSGHIMDTPPPACNRPGPWQTASQTSYL